MFPAEKQLIAGQAAFYGNERLFSFILSQDQKFNDKTLELLDHCLFKLLSGYNNFVTEENSYNEALEEWLSLAPEILTTMGFFTAEERTDHAQALRSGCGNHLAILEKFREFGVVPNESAIGKLHWVPDDDPLKSRLIEIVAQTPTSNSRPGVYEGYKPPEFT